MGIPAAGKNTFSPPHFESNLWLANWIYCNYNSDHNNGECIGKKV